MLFWSNGYESQNEMGIKEIFILPLADGRF